MSAASASPATTTPVAGVSASPGGGDLDDLQWCDAYECPVGSVSKPEAIDIPCGTKPTDECSAAVCCDEAAPPPEPLTCAHHVCAAGSSWKPSPASEVCPECAAVPDTTCGDCNERCCDPQPGLQPVPVQTPANALQALVPWCFPPRAETVNEPLCQDNARADLSEVELTRAKLPDDFCKPGDITCTVPLGVWFGGAAGAAVCCLLILCFCYRKKYKRRGPLAVTTYSGEGVFGAASASTPHTAETMRPVYAYDGNRTEGWGSKLRDSVVDELYLQDQPPTEADFDPRNGRHKRSGTMAEYSENPVSLTGVRKSFAAIRGRYDVWRGTVSNRPSDADGQRISDEEFSDDSDDSNLDEWERERRAEKRAHRLEIEYQRANNPNRHGGNRGNNKYNRSNSVARGQRRVY